ncbi:MAG: phage head closure protein [bacterium]|nr:phage head closure protein [bacterium]
MVMKIGELRHLITLQTPTITKDSLGVVSETWSDTASVYAQIEALSGREYFAVARVNAEVTHRVRIRYLRGIVPAMRVVAGAKALDIQAVLDVDGKKRELTLMCVESEVKSSGH